MCAAILSFIWHHNINVEREQAQFRSIATPSEVINMSISINVTPPYTKSPLLILGLYLLIVVLLRFAWVVFMKGGRPAYLHESKLDIPNHFVKRIDYKSPTA